MSILNGRDWYHRPGASSEALDRLRASVPVDLPDSYYALLAETNGGEGPLPVNPFNLCLDAAEDVVDAMANSTSQGFVPFGGNGGGELLAFDVRGSSPWPIVTIDMVAGPQSAAQVTKDFNDFVQLIGRN